eukprot:jgi/Ulvmu1/8964/UM005_0055.1
MPTYNFKSIPVVPTAADFVDIILSKTQRQTPTVVHKGYAIQRIRSFYMRKVKYTASQWHDKLLAIVSGFPKVDDIHPFYADLLNVLYDKDHYKLALGQLSVARNLIDKLASDYVRLLKYGDSLYRCKQLKRAALGRMCTLMKRQAASLAYLEQVRQHMSRLPSIDPHTRTLLVCGYPNVGKSSFVNSISRADVEVQPYAFTTKSLYVGHVDYKYMRWQVIDTPGVLDRPLEERNTIEMQAVTAMAHLRAAVLYFMDISEQCGFTIDQQAALFHSIKPLFANKPVIVVCNKTDARAFSDLPAEQQQLIQDMAAEALRLSHGGVTVEGGAGANEASLMFMSTLKEDGIHAVRNAACDRLLAVREHVKVSSKRAGGALNRLQVVVPTPRDSVARPPCIPSSVLAERAAKTAGAPVPKVPIVTEKDRQERHGGAGVYSADLRKGYLLEDDAWKYDIMPEILDGHNVADFIDPDIDAKLAELEREEEVLEEQWQAELQAQMDAGDLDDEQKALLAEIRSRRGEMVAEHRRNKALRGGNSIMPRSRKHSKTIQDMEDGLHRLGMSADKVVGRMRSASAVRQGRKRERSLARHAERNIQAGDVDMHAADEPEAKKRVHSSRSRSMSRGKALSMKPPGKGEGVKDLVQKQKAVKLADKAQKLRNRMARAGEGDRVIQTKMPKHLFSGKRGVGKTDRR